jgi:predicted transposase/invertase (TIGR01784 family)
VDTSKEEGIKEGIKEGKQKGEKEKAIEIALNLISLKMDDDTIAKATGLSIVQIQELRNSK